MDFKKEMQQYKDDMVADLIELISIPSLNDEDNATENAPFGDACNHALEWFLNKAKKDGFETDNVDGYAGICSLGDFKESVGVLGHLDVVPVGEGWSRDPFGGEVLDGVLYGRGSGDDKGPTIAAYYALKCLKNLKLKQKRKVEIIVGVDEETGMRCMDYYKTHRTPPQLGFVPDASFPVIYGEKGILNIKLHGNTPTIIESMVAGERPNIVIGKAKITITSLHNPEKLDYYCKSHHIDATAHVEGPYTAITFVGKYSHASRPQKGLNAAYHALNYVGTTYNDTLAQNLAALTKGYLGEGLDLVFNGVYMGFLTANLGMVNIQAQGEFEVIIDIRYPNDLHHKDILATITKSIEAIDPKIMLDVVALKEPHFVNPNSELVTTLTKVYQDYTGDTFTPPLTMGGGTYARTLNNFVAFGMDFISHTLPHGVGGPHEKDEGILVDDLVLASAIYAEALYRLAYENS